MIACPRCHRANGPRAQCVYCGAPLPEGEVLALVEQKAREAEDTPKAIDPDLLKGVPEPLRRALLQGKASGGMRALAASGSFGAAGRGLSPPEAPRSATRPTAAAGLLPSANSAARADGAAHSPAPPAARALGAAGTAFPRPATAGLTRGRGPWGRRGANARLLIVPDPAYAKAVPWLKLRLTETLGFDGYTSAQLLQRDHPALLREFDDVADARARAVRLQERGIRTLLLTPEVVSHWAQVRVATGCRLGLHRVRFETDGEAVELSAGQVVRGVLGEIRPPTPGPVERERSAFLGRTPRLLQPRPLESFAGAWWLLDLYLTGGPPPLRIRADAFDYGFLGPDRGISSWQNLNTALERWRSTLGDFPVDQAFRRVVRAVDPAQAAPEESAAGIPEQTAFLEYGMVLALAAEVPPA